MNKDLIKHLHDQRNPDVLKVLNEVDVNSIASLSSSKNSDVRPAHKVVLQFEAFIRKNARLLSQYPKSLYQTAINEPDSSTVSKCVRRQIGRVKQPCLQLTRKSQQTQYCIYFAEEAESVATSCIVSAIPEDGVGPRIIYAVGPKVKVYDLNTEAVDSELGCLPDEDWEEVLCLAASQDGRWVVAGYNACIKLWDVKHGRRALNLQYLGGASRFCAMSKAGSHFATGSDDGSAMVWRMDGSVVADCEGKSGKVTCLALNNEGTQLVVGYHQGNLKNFDVDENSETCSQCIQEYRSHERKVTAVAFSLKGTDVISGSRQNIMKWSAQFGNVESTICAHRGFVRSLAYCARALVSTGDDKLLKLWDKRSLSLFWVVEGHTGRVSSVSALLDPQDGGFQYLHSASMDGELRVWNLDIDNAEEVGKAAARMAKKAAKDAGGGQAAPSKQQAQQVDVQGQGAAGAAGAAGGEKVEVELEGHSGATSCVCVSQSGHLVVTGGADRTLKVWSFPPGGKSRLQQTFADGITQPISCVGLTPDSQSIVAAESAWDFSTLGKWEIGQKSKQSAENEESSFKKFENGHTDNISCVVVSGVGRAAVALTGSYDRRVKLFDVATGLLVLAMEGHPRGHHHWVTSVGSSATYVVSGSRDKTVRVWERKTGKLLHAILVGEKVQCVAISRKEHWIAVGVGCRLQIWSWWRSDDGRRCKADLQQEWDHSADVHTCEFHNEDRIISCSRREICLWSRATQRNIMWFPSWSEEITCMCKTGPKVVYGTNRGSVYMGKIQPPACLLAEEEPKANKLPLG